MSEYQKRPVEPGETLVRMETSLGGITFRFFPEDAPKAVESFLTHCRNGYYDGVIFHRVIPDFMIQGGDPTGTGMGGKSAFGREFENEPSDRLSHVVGTLSMANAGPDTNGSQFFVVQGRDAAYLDGDYSIFGQVVDGQDTVDRIAKLPRNRQDRPANPPEIVSTEILTA